jgi:trehalose 6-phosphate synthase
VLEEAGGRPAFVFIQDYHFGLLPRMLKESGAPLAVGQFWHIPWPNPETFRAFPWKDELLEGMLGNDILGFHLRYHVQNFLDTVDRNIECHLDRERDVITRQGHRTQVRPFPISIDVELQERLAGSAEVEAAMVRWRHELKLGDDQVVGVGIERIDYTKGIPERLKGIDECLRRDPELRGRLVFVQVGVPSRSHVPEYRRIEAEVDDLVERINWAWGDGAWQPIRYVKRHCGPVEMAALHRVADFFMVTSLHDGMNLVAKEFVASRVDDGGVLILSRFTGAARELNEAIQVNPFSVEELADAVAQAAAMGEEERQRRMKRMRATVAGNNVYRWAGKFIHALLNIDPAEGVPGSGELTAGAVGASD